MKTNIVNKTKQSFGLKEGNAGAYRFLKQLDPGAKYPIRADSNATYREYVVATGKKGNLSSSPRTILVNIKSFISRRPPPGQDPGSAIYKTVPSNPRESGLSKASEPCTVGGAGAGSNPRALSVASSKPHIGISNQNERVSWYKKVKSRFK